MKQQGSSANLAAPSGRRRRTLDRGARLLAFGALVASSAGCGAASSSASADSEKAARCEDGYQVDLLLQAQVPIFNDMVAGFKDGFSETSGLSTDEVEYNEQNAQGDSGNYLSLARSMADSDSGLVAVIGTAPTVALAETTSSKPIVSISMTDPVGSDVAESLEEPGTNVTGSQASVPIRRMLEEIKLIQADVATVGTIYSAGDDYMASFAEQMADAAEDLGISVEAISVVNSSDVLGAARSLSGRVDALVIGQDGNVAAALPTIANSAQDANVPLYLAYRDDSTLQAGITGGISEDWREIGRLAGEVAGDVCNGADPAETAWAVYDDQTWYFQQSEIDRVGLTVPAELGSTAEILP